MVTSSFPHSSEDGTFVDQLIGSLGGKKKVEILKLKPSLYSMKESEDF